MRHNGLIGLDLNTAPRLRNDAAVGSDFKVGWSTSPYNVYRHTSVLDHTARVTVVVEAASFLTYRAAAA